MDGIRKIKIGDLVKKTGGYGQQMEWVGLVIQLLTTHTEKAVVLTEDGVEHWVLKFCEKISG